MSRNRLRITGAGCAMALAASLASLPPVAMPAEAAPAARATTRPAADDILTRLQALKGFTVTEVTKNVPQGFRFFAMTARQPIDHDHPSKGTFEQRLTLLHRDVSRPTVFFTTGYNIAETPRRSEPTRIVDGNQVSMEHRFFEPSRPKDADWQNDLTIRQAAADQHRLFRALKPIYERNWIATGGSKGGMTATYYRYFHPQDMSGTVPYVAPNDADNDKDSYNRFLATVGKATCRRDLVAVQRRALGKDRAWFVARLTKASAAAKLTFNIVGSADKAFELAVVDTYFGFWQYQPETSCGYVPDAAAATREEMWEWFGAVNPLTAIPLTGYTDQELRPFIPYYYQAAAQLGWPQPYEEPLRDVLKYPGAAQPVTVLPKSLKPVRFDRTSMAKIDRWVRTDATRMLFVDGSLDPWSAEPFTCGDAGQATKRDCLRFDVRGGNHLSTIQQLPEPQRALARAKIQTWAGLTADDRAVTSTSRQGDRADARLDRPMVEQRRIGR